MSPEQLEYYGSIYMFSDEGDLPVTTGKELAAKRRGE